MNCPYRPPCLRDYDSPFWYGKKIGRDKPTDQLSVHMTLIDIHPATLARVIVIFALLQQILVARTKNEKSKVVELHATLFYLYISTVMPDYCCQLWVHSAFGIHDIASIEPWSDLVITELWILAKLWWKISPKERPTFWNVCTSILIASPLYLISFKCGPRRFKNPPNSCFKEIQLKTNSSIDSEMKHAWNLWRETCPLEVELRQIHIQILMPSWRYTTVLLFFSHPSHYYHDIQL